MAGEIRQLLPANKVYNISYWKYNPTNTHLSCSVGIEDHLPFQTIDSSAGGSEDANIGSIAFLVVGEVPFAVVLRNLQCQSEIQIETKAEKGQPPDCHCDGNNQCGVELNENWDPNHNPQANCNALPSRWKCGSLIRLLITPIDGFRALPSHIKYLVEY